jgi:hypothetical protein
MQKNILFITIDSCRYDTFLAASAPNMKNIGTLYRAKSPSHFTYGAHSCFFMGFTPGVASMEVPYVNPKYGKIFRIKGGGFAGYHPPYMELDGANIIEGLRNRGYGTFGTGAVGWFNPSLDTGRVLTQSFHDFYYPGNTYSLLKQIAWIHDRINQCASSPCFVFLNIGETHVPYYHEGANWDVSYNPCVPFGVNNDARECRRRQIACVEFIDTHIDSMIQRFSDGLIIVCSDHGDAWGEDGLWEHGISHDVVLEVPLLFRIPLEITKGLNNE